MPTVMLVFFSRFFFHVNLFLYNQKHFLEFTHVLNKQTNIDIIYLNFLAEDHSKDNNFDLTKSHRRNFGRKKIYKYTNHG